MFGKSSTIVILVIVVVVIILFAGSAIWKRRKDKAKKEERQQEVKGEIKTFLKQENKIRHKIIEFEKVVPRASKEYKYRDVFDVIVLLHDSKTGKVTDRKAFEVEGRSRKISKKEYETFWVVNGELDLEDTLERIKDKPKWYQIKSKKADQEKEIKLKPQSKTTTNASPATTKTDEKITTTNNKEIKKSKKKHEKETEIPAVVATGTVSKTPKKKAGSIKKIFTKSKSPEPETTKIKKIRENKQVTKKPPVQKFRGQKK